MEVVGLNFSSATSSSFAYSLERIQFVGACNPPIDLGKKAIKSQFLETCNYLCGFNWRIIFERYLWYPLPSNASIDADGISNFLLGFSSKDGLLRLQKDVCK